QHDHDTIAASRLAQAEGDDASAPHTPHATHRPLQILRMILTAVDDDDVFRAAAHEQLTAGQVAEIAGVQPSITDALRREIVLPMVAQHDRGTREDDLPDQPLRQQPAVDTDDTQQVAGKWPPAADDLNGRNVLV